MHVCLSVCVRPCSLTHCGPYEGRSCPMEGHGWQHKLALPTITTLPLISPSPSSSFLRLYRLLSPLYFSSRLSSLSSYSSDLLLPPSLFLLSSTFSYPPLLPPPHFTFHIPLVPHPVCTSSVRGQLTLKRADAGIREINSLAYADKHTKCACSTHAKQAQMHTKSLAEALKLTRQAVNVAS